MQRIEDAALLRDYAETSSEDAFAALVSRHMNLVYSVALRQVHDPRQAEDIAQAVFIVLARRASQLRQLQALSSWLFQTTRLTANNSLRSEMRRQQRDHQAYLQCQESQSENEVWPAIAALLDSAVASLKEKDRQAILLRFYEGRSIDAIAAVLGASHAAAEKRLERAVAKLQNYFAKRGVVLSGAALVGAVSANSVEAAPATLARAVAQLVGPSVVPAAGPASTLADATVKAISWAKAKTVAALAVVLLAVAGLTILIIHGLEEARLAAAPNVEGAWEGLMHLDDPGVNPGELSSTHVVLKLQRTTNGYTATTDWIELGRRDIPMGKIVYRYPLLTLERTPRDTWRLTVKPGARQIILQHAVHFIQPDPVVLSRATRLPQVAKPLTEPEFAPRPGSDLQGYWTGLLGLEPKAMPVRVRIAEAMDGTFRAEGDAPMLGVHGRPLSVSYRRPNLEVSVATGTGLFEGEINQARTEISGWWTLDGESVPGQLRRADFSLERAKEARVDFSSSANSDLAGHWKGTWFWPGPDGKLHVPIRLALDIGKLSDGSHVAALANRDEFGYEAFVPASQFEDTPSVVHLEWKWREVAFHGALEYGKLIGSWLQGGGSFPLVFERTVGSGKPISPPEEPGGESVGN
jgi:RNA polymerase sigma factor (sigma-70 family)